MMAELLDFKTVSANSLDSVSDRDFILESLAALAFIGTHLSRLAAEMVLWSTSEFSFIRLNESFCTGSSFLPQLGGEKGNPREWIFCHYDPRWGKWKKRRFVRDQRWKLYGNGDLHDIAADTLEQNPNPVGREAAEARKRLQAVLNSIEKGM